jgi:hypothetical protein
VRSELQSKYEGHRFSWWGVEAVENEQSTIDIAGKPLVLQIVERF